MSQYGEFKEVENIRDKKLVKLGKMLKEYKKYNTDAQKLSTALKATNKKKNEIYDKIKKYMEINNIKDLNSENGKVKYEVYNKKKSLSKTNIKKQLTKYFQNETDSDNVTNYLFDNREFTVESRVKFELN